MARKIKMEVTSDDVEQAAKDQGDFVVPESGYYILQAKEFNAGYSKDDDGKEDKSRPRIEVIFEIVGVGVEDAPVGENYGNIWDYISFSKEAGWHRAQFLRAYGVIDGTGAWKGEIDLDDPRWSKKVLARLRKQRARGDNPPRARVANLMPYEDRDMADAFGGNGGGEEEAFFGGDSGEEMEAGDYTEEELTALEPKELGKIAKEEFELEPSEFVVKTRGKVDVAKSTAKLVTAILEAQEEDKTRGSDENESPF